MTSFKYTSMAFTGVLASIRLSGVAASADELIVPVNTIKEAGEIHIAIYDSVEAFEADRGDKGSSTQHDLGDDRNGEARLGDLSI